ncbi:MAG: N-acetylneuraminate synthase family protein [Candidatus Omnitrophica bacterium]|nr:N-acetylneuraminate synthase family protein [Candidatus Omnitrophota bacterium]
MATITIGNKRVGPGRPTFVIAEAGCNHECNLTTAKRMVREAARAGADAIKFQTYKAETLATRTAPKYWKHIPGSPRTQFEFFKQLDHFGRREFAALAQECRRAGILFLSTPWDLRSADLLDDLGMPAFKIGSADLTYLPLIRHCAAKGKPMILSTGAATLAEMRQAVNAVLETGNRQLILLHCILAYHTEPPDVHLAMIGELQRRFPDVPIGFSDHTIADACLTIQTAAVAAGARVVEKHFTLNQRASGNDHWHSLEPGSLAQMVKNFRVVEQALGQAGPRRPLACELPARRLARRSVVAIREIPRGARIEEGWLTGKRPGTGISPAQLSRIVGRRARRTIPEDTVITWSMIGGARKLDEAIAV